MFGFEVRNLNNDVIIDGENKHPFFHEIKTVDISSTGAFTIDFTPTNKTPFITAYTENGRVQILNVFKNDSNQYYSFSYGVGKTGNTCRFDIYVL
jgi:hypothetical protein